MKITGNKSNTSTGTKQNNNSSKQTKNQASTKAKHDFSPKGLEQGLGNIEDLMNKFLDKIQNQMKTMMDSMTGMLDDTLKRQVQNDMTNRAYKEASKTYKEYSDTADFIINNF